MSEQFDNFIKNNKSRIHSVGEDLKNFEIEAKTIGIRQAKSRVKTWLENFDKIGFTNFELPLYLLEKIDFIEFNDMADKIITDAEELIKENSSYITCLGEPNESSFKITSKFHRHKNFNLSLSALLNNLPNTNENKILLFDDFLNSGGQLVSIFYALLNKQLPVGEINDEADSRTNLNAEQIRRFKKAEIHLFYYQAFEEGTKKVEQRLKKELGLNITIHSHFNTNNNDSAFGDKDEQEKIVEGAIGKLKYKSIFHGKNYADLTELYLTLKTVGELLLRVKEKKWEERKFADRALGYGNLCRVLVSYSNVPTITLTALWQNGDIEINGNIIEWKELLPRTKKVLQKAKSSTESNKKDIDFDSIGEELQALYENDEFREGLKKAENYFEEHGSHPKVLKHALRFNMRDKNWSRITEIINGLDDAELTDEQKAFCMFTLFECTLREGYEFRSNVTKFGTTIRKIREHLNHVPASQKNSSEYHYLLGRWHLEMWWAHRATNNLANLTQALSSFNLATSIKDTWWTQCYKCIVLKLLTKESFLVESDQFRKRIFEFQKKKPLQPSVKIYCITALILLDKKMELERYLMTLNQEISPTDFEDSLIHRIEMIYNNEKHKKYEYEKIISNWIKLLPRK
jgi:hypothetical protein